MAGLPDLEFALLISQLEPSEGEAMLRDRNEQQFQEERREAEIPVSNPDSLNKKRLSEAIARSIADAAETKRPKKPEEARDGISEAMNQEALAKKLLVLHAGQTEYRLKVFAGTPCKELETAIRQQLGFPNQGRLVYTDEDGDPVVLSSSFPDGAHLHVAMWQEPEVAPARVADWRVWDSAERGQISEDKRTWQIDSNEGGCVYSPALPMTGRHVVVLELSNTYCCTTIGLVPASKSAPRDRPSGEEFKKKAPHMIYTMSLLKDGCQYNSHSGGSHEPHDQPFLLSLLVDMDARVVTFSQHGTRAAASHLPFEVGGLPSEVKLAATHPKHGWKITIRPELGV